MKPFHDLFKLLQCVLPGVFLLVTKEYIQVEGSEKSTFKVVTRGLPSLRWMQKQSDMLYDIYIANSYEKLLEAAEDETSAYMVQYESLEE